jgi:wyosine [tRNA(Phe)-imidazoG37] synthetase (radical SAM superfamily)
MFMPEPALTFGPVPSRRLGHSLGVNNIPAKTCSYACVYCQAGRTNRMRIRRQAFYPPDRVVEEVKAKILHFKQAGTPLDAVTFVPNGEPTLDGNLGEEIRRLRPQGCKIAVISNASLLTDPGVRRDLQLADWVSLKVDSVLTPVWKKMNRPFGKLDLKAILEAMIAFSESYTGELVTETMLVAGMNDEPEGLAQVAEVLRKVTPSVAYLSVPTRPPAEPWVSAPAEDILQRAYRLFREGLDGVELLISYEGDDFAVSQDAAREILAVTAVHPMREDAVLKLLAKSNADQTVLDALIRQGRLARVEYHGQRFFIRRYSPRA